LKSRQVVVAFLQSGQRILLLRRNGKVGTYEGRWAAFRGYLEEDEDRVYAPDQRYRKKSV